MPILQKIVISNFRNIEFQELEFSPNINCIWVNNGEGKTTLLEAVYYLSMTKQRQFQLPARAGWLFYCGNLSDAVGAD